MDDAAAVRFTAVSVYLMITAVFLAGIMAEDPVGRLETLRRGYLFAAWGAGFAGILGYFDIAGLGSIFTLLHSAVFAGEHVTGARRGAASEAEVIAGLNLPMLIKLAGIRADNDMEKALLESSEAGRKYINVASRVLSGK